LRGKAYILIFVTSARLRKKDTALRLSKYFGTSAKFWLGLQDDYDFEESGNFLAAELQAIPEAMPSIA
jgi:antitoxin HigA-1